MKFELSGHSDDVLHAEGDVDGEMGCYDASAFVRVRTPSGEGCFVVFDYSNDRAMGLSGILDGGCWHATVSQIDEGIAMECDDGSEVHWRTRDSDWAVPE